MSVYDVCVCNVVYTGLKLRVWVCMWVSVCVCVCMCNVVYTGLKLRVWVYMWVSVCECVCVQGLARFLQGLQIIISRLSPAVIIQVNF